MTPRQECAQRAHTRLVRGTARAYARVVNFKDFSLPSWATASSLLLAVACAGEDPNAMDTPLGTAAAAGQAPVAGSGAAGSGVAGSGVAGSGVAGSGVAGSAGLDGNPQDSAGAAGATAAGMAGATSAGAANTDPDPVAGSGAAGADSGQAGAGPDPMGQAGAAGAAGAGPVDPTEPVDGSLCSDGTLAKGFYVEDGRIYDNHCQEFMMRGVNYPYVWYKDSQNTEQMFSDIASAGANAVRVVLATGAQWDRVSGAEVSEIIGWAKANKLVAILEVHDSTGYGDTLDPAPGQVVAVHPDDAVAYWLSSDIQAALAGNEAYVMINIANEAFGNDASDQWEPFHAGAVAELRAGALEHLFIVDAPNWGQDWSNTMRDGTGPTNIFNADPQRNTVFSVHMYDVYSSSDVVWAYFENFLGSGMALIVGEFAADHGPSLDVDEDTILEASLEHRIGYLGWSWSGNNSDLASLDIAQNFNASGLTSWGTRLIDGANGIRQTSAVCACFNE